MTHDLEARLRAAYAPLAPDPARGDDLAAALLDAPQAPAPGRLGRVLPWGVAIAATLVGAFLLARGPGPADRAPRPAHDGPAVTAFVDAHGRATLAGVDGRALHTWELGDLPIDLAIAAEIGAVLAAEVAPYAPPVDSNALPRTPDAPTLGPALRGPSPVALVIDAAPDVPWRHVETMLLGAAFARVVDVEFLDPARERAPIRQRLPLGGRAEVVDGREVHRYEQLEFAGFRVGLVPNADGAPALMFPRSGRARFALRDGVGLAVLGREIAAARARDASLAVEVEVLPGADGDTITYLDTFGVLHALRDAGVNRVLFAAGAGRRSK